MADDLAFDFEADIPSSHLLTQGGGHTVSHSRHRRTTLCSPQLRPLLPCFLNIRAPLRQTAPAWAAATALDRPPPRVTVPPLHAQVDIQDLSAEVIGQQPGNFKKNFRKVRPGSYGFFLGPCRVQGLGGMHSASG